MTTHNHYFRTVPDGVTRIDVYRLLDMFDVTCPVAQHVIKKALAAGQRGHKTVHRDWQDIADSAGRKLEMIQEDDGWNKESVEEAALATVGDTSVIKLTPFELQSGLDRVQWAEILILQLPEDHDGRNSWLLNYGVKKPIIRELYTEATEDRMDVVGQNGNTAEHYPADEWIPSNGQRPELPDGTFVDIKFADGGVGIGHSADLWEWLHEGASDEITHYRIHQPE